MEETAAGEWVDWFHGELLIFCYRITDFVTVAMEKWTVYLEISNSNPPEIRVEVL
jgi:hypothetical protein